MNKIIKKARTIQENKKSYSKGEVVDYRFLNEWRDVRTLLSDKYFEEMLEVSNMTKDEFAYSLQTINNDMNLEEDRWFYTFTEIIEGFDYSMLDFNAGVNLATLPFSRYLGEKLEKVVALIENVDISEKVIETFIETHALEMFGIIGKIIAMKLAIYKETHTFNSDNQEERFIEFLKNTLSSKECFYKFYEEYPVAARIATVRTLYLIKNYIDILENLEKDHQEIKAFLGVGCLKFTGIKLSTGDSHEQGKAVSILEFENEKLVYKPKDLRISSEFEKFIDWYVKSSNLLPIKIPKGIYKENYTYNEFIEEKYCLDDKQVERFYTRYGYLIAICYLLNINDLHLENIIAHGEYPVIIDMETLFQRPADIKDDTLYFDLIRYLEIDSVSNSFLLPKQVNVGLDSNVDLSALNGREVKLNQKILLPKMVNTDEFHYENAQGKFAGGNNIPKYNKSEEVDVSKYNLMILEGFNDFIYFIKENKEECMKVLESFKGKKIRSITKSTERYASMIRFADHPNYNIEMKYRERLMMNIWAYPYRDKRIICSEVRDLVFNDIPIFYTYTDSTDLIDSHGKVYADFHSVSGLDSSISKIKKITEKEIKRQQCILLASLGIMDTYLNQKVTRRDIEYNVRKINCLKQARKIGYELMKEAYTREDKCSFISIDCDNKKHWRLIPSDISLYSGLSGIAIFFLEMYVRTKEESYFKNYQAIIKTAIEQTKNMIFDSAFTGWLSPVYPLILEYKYLNRVVDSEYLKFTAKKLEKLKEEEIRKLKNSDYISGIAGIVRLLTLVKDTFEENYVTDDIIEKFAKILMERLASEDEQTVKRIGIAHGISGVMFGLISAGKIESSDAKKMLQKEFQLEMLQEDAYKWCWGLSGMIQARIAIMGINSECIDKEELDELIRKFEASLTTIINNDTLCHGNGSIITTLKMIYEYTHEDKWLQILQLWISNINMVSLFGGYKIPKVADITAKGMFDGYFGIAWLHLYVSGTVNNILLLETK